MQKNKLKSNSDQRSYTLIYNDFLESDLLDKHEKLIYIVLKRFCNGDTMQAFPSVARIKKITGISDRWIRASIKHMEELGVISIERRKDPENEGSLSNIYTLHDFHSIWTKQSNEPTDEELERRYIDMLESRGYVVIKKEHGAADQSKAPCTKENNSSTIQYKGACKKSQPVYNKFKNFPEREYSADDYAALERLQLGVTNE